MVYLPQLEALRSRLERAAESGLAVDPERSADDRRIPAQTISPEGMAHDSDFSSSSRGASSRVNPRLKRGSSSSTEKKFG
jgi:hypothetical protein